MSTQVFFLQFVQAGILFWSPVAGQQVNPVTIPSYVIPGSNGDQDCCDGHPELQFIVDTLLNPTRLETMVTNENCQRPADTTTAMSTEGTSEILPVTTMTPPPETTDSQSNTDSEDTRVTTPSVETTSTPGLTPADHPCGPGWRQVVFINMTDPATNCPPGFNLTSFPKRTCGKSSPYSRIPYNRALRGQCLGTTFSTSGTPYTRVCGRIHAYISGVGTAFYNESFRSIDGYYVDGFSLIHRFPSGVPQHIWSFAVGNHGPFKYQYCPCIDGSTDIPPSYVGNDYFCDVAPYESITFHPGPLWDGQSCSDQLYACACKYNNPPWFTKTLPSSTTDDIELKQCSNHGGGKPTIWFSVPFDLVELYVQ